MTRNEYFEFHKQCCNKMLEITQKKNHDYAGFEDNPFANFTIVERTGIATTEQGFLTRIMDKISRINSFIIQGTLKVKDEKIEDTILDACNYLILLAGYLKSKKALIKMKKAGIQGSKAGKSLSKLVE
ncbi:MAG: hypothetical protein ACFFDF_20480 [Candidatus Odinarchaeota archaeon]